MRVCAIHQPNFFPWSGYFDKIRRADVFVILDAVDYPRAGSGGMGSWSNRVKLAINGEARWWGAPMVKQTQPTPINDSWIAGDPKWRNKALRSMQQAYAKAPNFKTAFDLVEPLILNPEQNISHYNVHAIRVIAEAMGLDSEIVLQSELGTEAASTDLLIEITKKTGADVYLAGGGAGGYQEDEKFAASGLELRYQNFKPIAYRPENDFIPGLSIIDYLMHVTDWSRFPEGDA
ncbi:WbqC family protein [Hyphobacterium marinum]|uniref:WbqC family protein n=1 Tax=Hyphobacterium marinum TaxID=3116574 RepID=A0ABU7LY37_9PROT|nr:WbqC family protein [Hyphobacterium sp. Y6023]MEE2566467.1 WbqC family protein [Hyphobacterium sp. Y6023]